MVVVNMTADKPGKINCRIHLTSPHKVSATKADGNRLTLIGQVEADGIHFQSVADVEAEDGKVVVEDGGLRVSDANSFVIVLVAATNFKNYRELGADPAARCTAALEQASSMRGCLRTFHVDDYQHLFRRVSLDLLAGTIRLTAAPPISASATSTTATTPTWPHSSSSMADTCSSPPAARAGSPPICRASGMSRSIRPGTANTPATSIRR